MRKQIVIFIGHPDPAPERLCRQIASAYAEAAVANGHEVTTIDLAHIDVPFLRSQAEFEHGDLPPTLRDAAEAMKRADHLVYVFPLWLGTMPALLKAFLEQVLRPGVTFRYRSNGFPERLLKGHSARFVITMGMPAIIYRLIFGFRNREGMTLRFTGIAPVRRTLVGNVAKMTASRHDRCLRLMRQLGARAI